MSDPKVFIAQLDISQITQLSEDLQKKAVELLKLEVHNLAISTHEEMTRWANNELHDRREKFVQGVRYEKISDSTWMVVIPSNIAWIDDGLPSPFPMLQHLLASPKAKNGKNGRYIIIPIEHNKGVADNTPHGNELRSAVQAELKKRGVMLDRLERDGAGQPKLGLLHKLTIPDNEHPVKTHEGPGMGKGAVGDPRQGKTGATFLTRARVYQNDAGKDLNGAKTATRHVFTFRTVTDKQDPATDWVHPGLKNMHFMDRAYTHAVKEWETKAVPRILADLGL